MLGNARTGYYKYQSDETFLLLFQFHFTFTICMVGFQPNQQMKSNIYFVFLSGLYQAAASMIKKMVMRKC